MLQGIWFRPIDHGFIQKADNYWRKKVDSLLEGNAFHLKFRKWFGVDQAAIKQLKADYFNGTLHHTENAAAYRRFNEIYTSTKGFFGPLKRLLMGLSFFEYRSSKFIAAFAEIDSQVKQQTFNYETQTFNQNVANPLSQAYDNVYAQLALHPTQRIVEREVVHMPPSLVYAQRAPGRRPIPIRRPGGVMVHDHVSMVVAPEVRQANAVYHQNRARFLNALDTLSTDYPYLMEQEKKQGLYPERPPSRLLF